MMEISRKYFFVGEDHVSTVFIGVTYSAILYEGNYTIFKEKDSHIKDVPIFTLCNEDYLDEIDYITFVESTEVKNINRSIYIGNSDIEIRTTGKTYGINLDKHDNEKVKIISYSKGEKHKYYKIEVYLSDE